MHLILRPGDGAAPCRPSLHGIAVTQAGPAAAQGPQTDASVPTVTVVAPAPNMAPEVVGRFSAPHSRDRLAHWRAPICPLVAGFTPEQNGFIREGIISNAREAAFLDR